MVFFMGGVSFRTPAVPDMLGKAYFVLECLERISLL